MLRKQCIKFPKRRVCRGFLPSILKTLLDPQGLKLNVWYNLGYNEMLNLTAGENCEFSKLLKGGGRGGGEEIQCCSRKLRKVWDYIVSGGLKGQSKIEYFVWEREATITNYEKVSVQIVGVLLYSVSTFRI